MAKRSAKFCEKAGCRGIIRDGVCSSCGPVKRGFAARPSAATRQRRGYDEDWLRVRRQFVAEATLKAAERGEWPKCGLCGEAITDLRGVHVDHIREFSGLNDPLRLDSENLQLAHSRCNLAKAGKNKQAR